MSMVGVLNTIMFALHVCKATTYQNKFMAIFIVTVIILLLRIS